MGWSFLDKGKLSIIIAVAILATFVGTVAAQAVTNIFVGGEEFIYCGQDSSVTGFHLTALGTQTPSEDSLSPFGKGVSFDGIGDAYESSISIDLVNGFAYTTAIDYQPSGALTRYRLLNLFSNNGISSADSIIDIRISDIDGDLLGALALIYRTASETTVTLTTTEIISVGKHLLGIRFDGVTAKFFLDGIEVFSGSISNLKTTVVNLDKLGTSRTGTEYYRGSFYDFRLFDNPPAISTMISQTTVATANGNALGDETAWYQFNCVGTQTQQIWNLLPMAFIGGVVGMIITGTYYTTKKDE